MTLGDYYPRVDRYTHRYGVWRQHIRPNIDKVNGVYA